MHTRTHIYLLTVATRPDKNLDKYVQMCEQQHGVPLNVLGMHDPRFQRWGNGFGVKIEWLQRACEAIVCRDPEALFIFTDAFDVMLVRGMEDVYRQYKHFGVKVIYSAELFCHPDPDRFVEYPIKCGVTYPYLNSGTFMGRASTMLEWMRQHPYTIDDDDQRYHTDLYFQHRDEPGQVVLDTEARLFMCLAGDAYNDLTMRVESGEAEFVNQRTRSTPCFLHLNGYADRFPDLYRMWEQPEVFVQSQQRWKSALRSKRSPAVSLCQ